jgi:hypothetical protein
VAFLIQILLPRRGGGSGDVPDADYALTRTELVERFGGVGAYLRSPAQSAWTAPDGRVDRDEVVMVEAVTETFDREWWRGYAVRLAGRFRQETIHVRALPLTHPR